MLSCHHAGYWRCPDDSQVKNFVHVHALTRRRQRECDDGLMFSFNACCLEKEMGSSLRARGLNFPRHG